MDDVLKTMDIKYLNVENWLLLFAFPIKISGYAPVCTSLVSLHSITNCRDCSHFDR